MPGPCVAANRARAEVFTAEVFTPVADGLEIGIEIGFGSAIGGPLVHGSR